MHPKRCSNKDLHDIREGRNRRRFDKQRCQYSSPELWDFTPQVLSPLYESPFETYMADISPVFENEHPEPKSPTRFSSPTRFPLPVPNGIWSIPPRFRNTRKYAMSLASNSSLLPPPSFWDDTIEAKPDVKMVVTPQGNVPMVEIEIVDAPPDDLPEEVLIPEKILYEPSFDPK